MKLQEHLLKGKERKERKETLFKCQVYLALRHTNNYYWGHCKLKLIQIKLNQMQVFEARGKPEYPGEYHSEQRTNKLNPHIMPSLGIEPGPHWWEASALTTTAPLLSLL